MAVETTAMTTDSFPERTEDIMSTDSPNTTDISLYYIISEKLFVTLDPVVTVVGVVGNILMFATVQRKEFRNSAISVLISAVAIADTALLIIDFINNWLKMAVSVYLVNASLTACRLYRTLFPISYMYCAWAVVAISFERFLVVCFPFGGKVICTRTSACVTVVLLPLPIICCNIYNIWMWEIDEHGFCNIPPKHVYFMYYISPWLSGALYCYIPVLILVFCNGAIALTLARQKRMRAELVKDTGSTSVPPSNLKETKVTKTVIAICVSYLLMTLPVALYYVIQYSAGEFIYQGPEMRLAEVIIDLIGLTHYATNFFLYIVTSDSFRSEFISMVKCKANNNND